MKILFRTFIILTLFVIISGGTYLLVENTSISTQTDGQVRPKGTEGFKEQEQSGDGMSERSGGERDHHHAAGGGASILLLTGSILKVSVITILVLITRFFVKRIRKFSLNTA